MHRTLSISVPADRTDHLIKKLSPMPNVIGLSVERGSSLKPPGDVLMLQVLNRGTDDILRCIADGCAGASYSVATAELASLIDPANSRRIEKDYDEAVWEEMETGLRHNGRVTPNYVMLMGIGGMVAAVGLVSDPAPQAVSLVAAAVLAPGFDPLAKMALGLTHRNRRLIYFGVRNSLVGYSVLIFCSALAFWLMQAVGATTVGEFVTNPEVASLSNPSAKQLLLSIGGALAGGIIVASYRDSVIAGALIATAIIHSASMIGVSLAIGNWTYAAEGAERFGLDALLIVGCCYLLFSLKQRFLHRRQPLT